MTGILLVFSIFFMYISYRSWKNTHEGRFIYLTFVFFGFLLQSLIYIIADLLQIAIPVWYYFIINIAILLILYISIIAR